MEEHWTATSYLHRMATAIGLAMRMVAAAPGADAGSKRQVVHNMQLVRAWPFYGYHEQERLFIKVVL
ncbi:predicted protein [Haematococcus lacustris]|uniref:DNA polymerase delta/zeta catalytic subunit N-terminal domain-containing protein n=1 Tax=Haematococcus lacustris TaxID=44745 RepID=A0A699Y6I7_HAELA|nr:predicted protein [Haematococcus lacustris]